MDAPGAVRASLLLSRAKGLGPRRFKLLLESFGSAAAVLAADPRALQEVEGIGPAAAAGVAEAKSSSWPDEELRRAERLGLGLLALEDAAYPACLRAIYDPPPVLYVRGKLPELSERPRSLAVVGTRDASDYALALTRSLAETLAGAGVHVVSGLALGVDAAAHEGTLQAGLRGAPGKTVAVLGSGVDALYPRQNARLAERILEQGGAVVSEYAIGTSPSPGNFPARNRIVSGLSSGTLVIEAGRKSGALITADYALEEGRTVLAVPGRVGDPRASGALELLKQGALLVQDVSDVLDAFNWGQPAASAPAPRPTLAPDEQRVLDAVSRLGTPLLDDLMAETGLDASALLSLVTQLELAGVLTALPGGRYSA